MPGKGKGKKKTRHIIRHFPLISGLLKFVLVAWMCFIWTSFTIIGYDIFLNSDDYPKMDSIETNPFCETKMVGALFIAMLGFSQFTVLTMITAWALLTWRSDIRKWLDDKK